MPEKEGEFAAAVRRELARLRAQQPARIENMKAVASLVSQGELMVWNEAERLPSERSKGEMATRLVELAALCQRGAEDVCGLKG